METTAEPIVLPSLPVPHADWIRYASNNNDKPIRELIEPFKEYDSKLREVFAQQPDHPAINKSNVVEIFNGDEDKLTVRARDIDNESDEETQRYIMPLSKVDRKPNGALAVVQTIKEFQTNFQLFSESALVDMDWANVVVAGSAVVTSLLPAGKHGSSKRALREYYHQKVAPASDVDLFLYDLTEEQAIEKIKQIEQRIRDSILTETTTIRTKNAITIASQYPTRHVQIVLRIYRSISEILTGFDVDCSCAAYDGKQVYASPRAVASYMTQVNTVDLTRRSPSYENRLSKYSKRGFEIYFPLLDRSRVDPTLFERSFGRTLGLARLLVLEKLPKNADREAYVDQRRAERGRPAINRWSSRKLRGNMKDDNDDEVAEWVVTDDVSDYHTFTIPYGPKYNARKIERLLYAKDLLLNAEWNRPKERESILHRHPAFFGNAVDVVGDCCGYCPKPLTPEDEELAEEESKTYVSGNLTFIKDDPGRQAIGSFHPLTDDDWTEMAYVGNTARLCQAIVDRDLETVQDWLKQEGADPNSRDFTGRMPLHLAVCSSSPEIVQALIDGGARITPRIFDGKTALHLAAMHGQAEMVRAILTKSEANEEEEAEKEDARMAARKAIKAETAKPTETKGTKEDVDMKDNDTSEAGSDDDIDMLDEDESDNQDATTDASIIKIDHREAAVEHETLPEDDNEDEPDFYDVNVLAWDVPVSALHLAIANGHTDVVKVLVQDFGADILIPIKLVHDYNKTPRAAILPLVLALQLDSVRAQAMTTTLIELGASPAQADISHATALHYFSVHGTNLLNTMVAADRPAAQRAVAHLKMGDYQYRPDPKSALQLAIEHTDVEAVDALLDLGAKPEVDYDTYLKSFKSKFDMDGTWQSNEQQFRQNLLQPVFIAIDSELPSVAMKLLDAGADVNSLNTEAWRAAENTSSVYGSNQRSVLDAVREKVEALAQFLETGEVKGVNNFNSGKLHKPLPLKAIEDYTKGLEPDSYAYWTTLKQAKAAQISYDRDLENYNKYLESRKEPEGTEEKRNAVTSLLDEFKKLEAWLVEHQAKTFKELYPIVKIQEEHQYHYSPYEPAPPTEWHPNVSFQISDLTDGRHQAYLKLYQACWEGDLSVIKELTLAVWGDNQTPLQIAVQDNSSFSPFAIAVLRRHVDVAKAILEIAQAQYGPEEKKGQSKHTLHEIDSDDESVDPRDEGLYIYGEIIDDRFTIENIGEIQSQVKSNITPLRMMSWHTPVSQFFEEEDVSKAPQQVQSSFSSAWRNQSYSRYRARSRRTPRKVLKDAANGRTYQVDTPPEQETISEVDKPSNLIQLAIFLDDLELLRFLITLGDDYTRRATSKDDDSAVKYFRVSETDFLYAMRLGRLQVLEELIKRTGAGIPLDDLVKRSGVAIPEPEKPKSYQGLSVHGKKRADWANAGRDIEVGHAQEQHPPLLHAARQACMQSVEWFLSDAPARCYSEFAVTHQDDSRIQNLAKSKSGIEGTINKWLGLRNHLLIHSVVLGKTSEESIDLLRYLCKVRPDAVHHKSASGLTPLQLAFSLHRREMIKVLVDNGADQTCRDEAGNNIIHSLLNTSFLTSAEEALPRTRELLDLIDKRLLSSLFLERTTAQPGAATPLATFMYHFIKTNNYYDTSSTPEHALNFLRLLLEFSKGEDLGVVNSEGDTPLHVAIRYGSESCLRIMLECRPELLWRENATGRTPYEVAEDGYLMKEVFSDPPSLEPPSASPQYWGSRRRSRYNRAGRNTNSVLKREPKTFLEKPEDERSDAVKAWDVCKEFAKKSQGRKRKLVSLVEANEVAKRLAVKKRTADKMANEDDKSVQGDEQEETKGDEVAVWYGMGVSADK